MTIFFTVLTIMATFVNVVHGITLTEHFGSTPCRPSEEQMKTYDWCVSRIYRRSELTYDEITSRQHLNRIVLCAYDKFQVIGTKGFDVDEMKSMINEMPITEDIKVQLTEAGEMCSTENEGIFNIMTCFSDEKKRICKLDTVAK